MRPFRLILFLVAGSLIFTACKDTERDAQSDEIVIKGKYENSENNDIVLESISPIGYFGLDTVTTDEEGNFYIRVKTSSIGVYRVKNRISSFMTLILSPGETVRITADAENVSQTYFVEGSGESELMLSFEMENRAAMLRLDSLKLIWEDGKYAPNNDSLRLILDTIAEDIFLDYRRYLETFLTEHQGSFASLFAIYQRLASRKIFLEEEDLEWFELVADGLENNYPGNPHTVDFNERMGNIRADLERRGLTNPVDSTISGSITP